MSSGVQHAKLAVRNSHHHQHSVEINGHSTTAIKPAKEPLGASPGKLSKSSKLNRDKPADLTMPKPKKPPEIKSASNLTNGIPAKSKQPNHNKVCTSPAKSNGKSSHSDKQLPNNGNITPLLNGAHEKAQRLFFPVPNTSFATFPQMMSFSSHNHMQQHQQQRKPSNIAETNRELVNQLNAIINVSTNPGAARPDKLPISRTAEIIPFSTQTPTEPSKSASKNRPRYSGARSSPLPPMRTSTKSTPKNVPIAPLGSRPQPLPPPPPPPQTAVQILNTQFLNGQPGFFLPLQHPMFPTASSIIPIPSSVVFPNGLMSTPQHHQQQLRVMSPMSGRSLVNILPKPGGSSPVPPTTKKPRKSTAKPVNTPAPLPSISLPTFPVQQPVVFANPVTNSEDLDQFLSCVQSKISQDFGRRVDVLSPDMNLISPLAPPSAEKSCTSPDPKVVARRLKVLRRKYRHHDVQVLECVDDVSRGLQKLTIAMPIPPQNTLLVPSTSATTAAEAPRVLPFKKRLYQSVPSPVPKHSESSTKDKSSGLANGPVSGADSGISTKSKSPVVKRTKLPALPKTLISSVNQPPLKISLKINRDPAGNAVLATPPSPAEKASKKRKADDTTLSLSTKRRPSATRSLLPHEFNLEKNACSAARLKKQISDSDLHVCVCKPVPAGSQGCGAGCQTRSVLFECDPQHCPCGEACSNQVIQKRQWVKDLEVFDTKLKGKGVRSTSKVTKGTFVCEYVGEVISIDKFRDRMSGQYKNSPHHYCLNIDSNFVIDAYRKGNIGRFINHSCEPNSKVEKWHVSGQPRMAIFAARDIEPGEEITYDYNFEVYDNEQKCACGTKTCRRLIGSRTSKPIHKTSSTKPSPTSDSPKKPSEATTVPEVQKAGETLLPNGLVPMSNTFVEPPLPSFLFYALPTVFSFHFQRPFTKARLPMYAEMDGQELQLVKSTKVLLGRVLRRSKLRPADKPKKRSKSGAVFASTIMPGLIVEALLEMKNKTAPATPPSVAPPVLLPVSSEGRRFPASYFKPVPWEPDVAKYTAEYKEEVIRCICTVRQDEGLMVCCDKCSAWQHCECVGVIPGPSPYLCERCSPRPVPTEIHANLPATANPDTLDCYVTLEVPNCQNFRISVGDCVYLTEKRARPDLDELYDPLKLDIMYVDKMFKDPDGTRRAFGFHLLRPHETFHEASRSFYENELLVSRVNVEAVNLEAVLGRCCVMDPATFAKGKPWEFPIQHCYIAELKTNKTATSFQRLSAKEKIFVNQDCQYNFETYTEKLQLKRTYRPHGVPVLKKKLKSDAAKKTKTEPKPIIFYVKEKCQRIQSLVERLRKRAGAELSDE